MHARDSGLQRALRGLLLGCHRGESDGGFSLIEPLDSRPNRWDGCLEEEEERVLSSRSNRSEAEVTSSSGACRGLKFHGLQEWYSIIIIVIPSTPTERSNNSIMTALGAQTLEA